MQSWNRETSRWKATISSFSRTVLSFGAHFGAGNGAMVWFGFVGSGSGSVSGSAIYVCEHSCKCTAPHRVLNVL